MLIVYIDQLKLQVISSKSRHGRKGYQKCERDCNVFKGTDSINELLNNVLQFKGES